jgi:Lipocalin-like domain
MTDIVGTWRLVRTAATADDGTAMPPPYGGGATAMGRVVFTADGRMMAVLCNGRADIPAGTQREYNSYCGAYTFDGRTLVTRVDASSDPVRFGPDQVRDVQFEGALMVFRPPRSMIAGKLAQRALYWERIAEV